MINLLRCFWSWLNEPDVEREEYYRLIEEYKQAVKERNESFERLIKTIRGENT